MSSSKTRLVPGVAGRYAIALFDLISSEKNSARLMQEVAALKEALSADLQGFLASATTSASQKEAVLAQVAKSLKLSDLNTRFVKLVARKGRADLLGKMLEATQTLQDSANGVVKVDVSSASKLSKAQEKEIESFVMSLEPGAKKVEMHVTLDKTLIAGTKIKVGAKAYDNSLAARMQGMASSLRKQAQSDF